MKAFFDYLRYIAFVAALSVHTGCGPKGQSVVNNRLAHASSPYLREHADNPVDWYEWGDEALGRAQREGKPLLISIGYASCHWCHVMEAETFMDTAVARFMNENFISIKIDREERPDIDQIYINAAQLISGNAGWPLNAFALPDGRPFFAATYFPRDRWLHLLKQVSESYANDERTLRRQASDITKGIQSSGEWLSPADSVTDLEPIHRRIYGQWKPYLDSHFGGLSGSPKFPLPAIWEFMLQYHYVTHEPSALHLTTTTLDGMSHGGIYDHLRGGFARYSTDSLWRVPHFEKMLYDNAQLVKLYAQAFQVTKDPRYRDVVVETLAFVEDELTSPEGLFYSSINADSEGEEGTFYVWSRKEIEEALEKKSAELFATAYNVTAEGNWERNKNVLFKSSVQAPLDPEAQQTLDRCRSKLLSVRARRTRPTTDDKILTSWNALMIEGYLQASAAFDEPSYLAAAVRAADIMQHDRVDRNGHVWRIKNNGHPPIDGFLDDYALLSRAFIKLYQATFNIDYLNTARSLADYLLASFRDDQSGLFFYSLDKSVRQIAGRIEIADEVMPSSNAVLAEVFYLLGEYYQDNRYTSAYTKMMRAVSGRLVDQGPYYASWARLKCFEESKPFEVAIVGPDAASRRNELIKTYLPTAIIFGGDAENLPLLENKRVPGKTMIYVCRDRVCKLPVENVDEALQQLKRGGQGW